MQHLESVQFFYCVTAHSNCLALLLVVANGGPSLEEARKVRSGPWGFQTQSWASLCMLALILTLIDHKNFIINKIIVNQQ
uniref:Uncharacterized protein n=1 Tax=Anguilla anguilla TaxID=7936 RepID=A0A0E9QQ33_ANGAN